MTVMILPPTRELRLLRPFRDLDERSIGNILRDVLVLLHKRPNARYVLIAERGNEHPVGVQEKEAPPALDVFTLDRDFVVYRAVRGRHFMLIL